MKNVIEYSHQLLQEHLTKEDIAIDLTIGNGNDTLFLVNIAKFVYGFDIQKQACTNTYELLKEYKNYKLVNDNHLNFMNYINEPFKAVIFNLGYLPKGDKNICTTADNTIITLKSVLKNIMIDGICVIVVYPGHKEGYHESIQLNEFLKSLDQKNYDVIKYEFINQVNTPPYLLAVRKRK